MELNFLLQLFVVPTTLLMLMLSAIWKTGSWLDVFVKVVTFLLSVLGIVIEIKLLNIL